MNRRNGFFGSRYGADALSAVLIAAAGLILLVVLFSGGRFLSLIALVPVGYAVFRILSADLPAREAENRAFLGFFLWIRAFFRLTWCRFRDRKTHLYFRCACCGRVLRVQRGSGVMTVSCPHCRTATQLNTGGQVTEEKSHP